MIVTVFRTRVRPDADLDELTALGGRMYEIASSMRGFVSYKDFAAEDGEFVSIVEFESLDTLRAWREHPEHVRAQQLGKSTYFSEYHIQVCDSVRDYSFRSEELPSSISLAQHDQ